MATNPAMPQSDAASRPDNGLRIAATCLLLLTSLAAGAETRLHEVEGRRVEVMDQGTGSPTVVFESGLGDGLAPWIPLARCISRRTRAIAYSRAGYGKSEAASAPRDYHNVTAELRSLLHSLDARPPYILVGHSLGGEYVQAYAQLHPKEVAGLVLVDPSVPGSRQRFRRELPKDAEYLDRSTARLSPPALAEWRYVDSEGPTKFLSASVYRGPVIVLSAQRPIAHLSDELSRLRRTLVEETASRYVGAELRRIASGHHIQRESPTAVLKAALELVARARGEPPEHLALTDCP